MPTAHLFHALLFSALVLTPWSLEAAEGPARERHSQGQREIPITSRNEITINARNDAEVQQRELWFSQMRDRSWGPWQRHGITFGRNDPITWRVPEGHWRIYVRITDVSGLSTPVPDQDTAAQQEFIVDRTAPSVQITAPASGSYLRGGATYDITWQATDPHLHSTPITILWSRGGDQDFTPIAEHIANSGSFRWNTPRDMTDSGRLRILAWDRAGNRGSAEIEGLVVDALPPSRNILGPEIVADRQVTLRISARDAGPAGMQSVQLWYSSDEGRTWNEGPQRSEEPWDSLSWTAPSDGHFLLNLLAVDRSGNATSLPVAADDAQAHLLVDTVAPVVSLESPIGIRQVGGSQEGSLRRIYKPGHQVQLRFQAVDENLGEGAARVLLQIEEGAPWEVIGDNLAVDQAFAFAIPDANTDSARIRVQVTDRAGNTGEATANETFSIRNVIDTGTVTIDFD